MTSSGRVTIGQPAPNFKCTAVVDGRFKECTLSAYTEANHWVCLVFFPKAWSFICPTEIRAFSSRLEEFLYSRSCAVVFCSTDSEHCLKAWNSTSEMEGGLGSLHIPLMSDCNHEVSRAYGVLNEKLGVAQRALFIIDPKGLVRADPCMPAAPRLGLQNRGPGHPTSALLTLQPASAPHARLPCPPAPPRTHVHIIMLRQSHNGQMTRLPPKQAHASASASATPSDPLIPQPLTQPRQHPKPHSNPLALRYCWLADSQARRQQ
ncbi:cTPxI [Friedmanniomyces endolithicus]|nr:cTPxI [Friedmanniomyces endolithicus]